MRHLILAFVLAACSPNDDLPDGLDAGTPHHRLASVKVVDYGAQCDGTTDDSQAFLDAFEALLEVGGGRIELPDGTCRWATARTFNAGSNNYIAVEMTGNGTASRILVDTPSSTMLSLANFDSFGFEDLAFFGDQATLTDASTVIDASHIKHLTFVNTQWFGVGALHQLIDTDDVGLYLNGNSFLGCQISNVNAGDGAVVLQDYQEAVFEGNKFIDFGSIDGDYYSKTPDGMPRWILAYDSHASVGGAGGGELTIRNNGFDEGGSWAVLVASLDGGVTGSNHVLIEGNAFGLGVGVGVHVVYAKTVVIRDNAFNAFDHTGREAVWVEGIKSSAEISRNSHQDGDEGTFRYVIDAYVAGSAYVHLEDNAYDSLVVGTGMPPIYVTTKGVRARLRKAQGAIVANTFVKPGATDGRAAQLSTSDGNPIGIALDGASSAGDLVRVVEGFGQEVQLKSDGSSAIAPGDAIGRSSMSAGRGARTLSGPIFARSLSTAAATSDYLVTVQWGKEYVPPYDAGIPDASPDLSTPPDLACSCSGTGPCGSVVAACGTSACGSDNRMYACSSSGWSGAGASCSQSCDGGGVTCYCSGTGPCGPITALCGESACGADNHLYSCSSTSGWVGPGDSCSEMCP